MKYPIMFALGVTCLISGVLVALGRTEADIGMNYVIIFAGAFTVGAALNLMIRNRDN